MRNTVLAWLALSAAMAQSDDVPALIAALSDANNATRVEAAALLRETLAANPSLRLDDHGEEFWTKRFATVLPGIKEALVLKLLPVNAQEELISSTGGGHVEVWRLDSYWKVDLQYFNPDTVAAKPRLSHEAIPVRLEPPTNYTGSWITYYVNGQKHQESQYRLGRYEGSQSAYHDNGQKSYEQHYVEGVCLGSDSGWYRDGRKMYEGQYASDKQNGTWTHWYPDGTMQTRAQYKSGLFDGVSTSWHANGQMQYEAHYENGQQNGLDQAWDTAGKLLWSREYVHGELVAK